MKHYGIYAFVREDFVHPPLPDISRTLKATKYDTSVLFEYITKENKRMIAQINPKTRECRCFDIRKLTPTETYRLMGVSDSDIRRLMDAPLAASAHYKLAGNSIVVDVMTALFRQVWFTQQDEGKRDR